MRARPALAAVLAAAALTAAGGARAAAAPLGTQPPRGADRAGMTRAFDRAHRGDRARVKLVGLRVYLESRGAGDGAAYYLTRGGPEGGYARGDFEYYRRVGGHRWRRVKSLPRSSENNLHPAYLWRVSSAGSGTASASSTIPLEEEGLTSTTETVERFSWKLRFGHGGRPFIFGYPGGDAAPPGVSGTIAYTHADGIETGEDVSCAGTFADVAERAEWPYVIGRETHGRRDYDIELQLRGQEGLRYAWTSVERPHGGAGECTGTDLIGSGLVAHLRAPVSRFEGHAASFSLPVGGSGKYGDEAEGTTSTLSFSGSLSFVVMGIALPHGLLGAPDDPDPDHR